MEISERERQFSAAVSKRLPKPDHISPCYGTSNIARMVPGGIILAVSNLMNFSSETKSLGLLSRLCPLPNAELYIAAVICSELPKLHRRLDAMLKLAAEGDSRFGVRNNNTSLCLGPDSQVYAYNKKISELEVPAQDFLGEPISVDQLYYSVYCPTATKEEQDVLRALLRTLRDFVGSTRMTEVPLWSELRLIATPPPQQDGALGQIATSFEAALSTAKIRTPADLGRRILASLMAKPFLILTGLSGSGKTKVAQATAEWLAEDHSQVQLVPVGADWTNRDNLFGYPDALNLGQYRLMPSSILQLLLSARSESEKDTVRPYFLILDEMNLSHVERYFADVLSSMESGKEIPLHELGSCVTSSGLEIPSHISFPSNLFIIGTVNIDETTYMFSPKVLDRANVIEFMVSSDEILDFLKDPQNVDLGSIAGSGAVFAAQFVSEAARRDLALTDVKDSLEAKALPVLSDILNQVFEVLKSIGAEFGFRPLYEISRFISFYSRVAGEGWTIDGAIDAAIMQKLLPKLHGSKTKLGPVLNELKNVVIQNRFPISYNKIERMEIRLKQNGFTSYAEA